MSIFDNPIFRTAAGVATGGLSELGAAGIAAIRGKGYDPFGVELSDIGNFLFGTPADPNTGVNAALNSLASAYGGNTPSLVNPQVVKLQEQLKDPNFRSNLDFMMQTGMSIKELLPEFAGILPSNVSSTGQLQSYLNTEASRDPFAGGQYSGTGVFRGTQLPTYTPVTAQSYTPSTVSYSPAQVAQFGSVPQLSLREIGGLAQATPQQVGRLQQLQAERIGQLQQLQAERATSAFADPFQFNEAALQGQQAALQQMQDLVTGGGRDAVSEAQFQRQVAEAETRRRAQALAIQREAEAQGLAGSGLQRMAELTTGQASTQDQFLAALQSNAQAQQRRDLAAQNLGALGLGIQSQEFQQQAAQRSALDQVALANIANALSAGQFNIGNDLQRQLANAQNALSAGQFNIGNDLQRQLANQQAFNQAQQFNIGNDLQRQLANQQAFNQAQTINNQNAFTQAQNQFQAQNQANLANSANQLAARTTNANAINNARQFGAQQNFNAQTFNQGLQSQSFNDQLALRQGVLGEIQNVANIQAGRQSTPQPGALQYLNAIAQPVASIASIFA